MFNPIDLFFTYLKIMPFYTAPYYFFVKNPKNKNKDPWDIYVDRCTVDGNKYKEEE